MPTLINVLFNSARSDPICSTMMKWTSQCTVVLSSNNGRQANYIPLCAKQLVFIVLQNVPSLHQGDLIPRALIDCWFHCRYGARYISTILHYAPSNSTKLWLTPLSSNWLLVESHCDSEYLIVFMISRG